MRISSCRIGSYFLRFVNHSINDYNGALVFDMGVLRLRRSYQWKAASGVSSPKTGKPNNNCEHNDCDIRIRCSVPQLGTAV
jgi:hypothetical protein